MPVTKSAKRALRQDRRRALLNQRIRRRFRSAVKTFRENPTAPGLKKAASTLDTAAKKGVIHKNKASRLKSRLAKLVPGKPEDRRRKAENRKRRQKIEKRKK